MSTILDNIMTTREDEFKAKNGNEPLD